MYVAAVTIENRTTGWAMRSQSNEQMALPGV
jgi:hypothetical protein